MDPGAIQKRQSPSRRFRFRLVCFDPYSQQSRSKNTILQ